MGCFKPPALLDLPQDGQHFQRRDVADGAFSQGRTREIEQPLDLGDRADGAAFPLEQSDVSVREAPE